MPTPNTVSEERITYAQMVAGLASEASIAALSQYDALAYDKVAASPTLGSRTETLLGERKVTERKLQVTIVPPMAEQRALAMMSSYERRMAVVGKDYLMPAIAKLCPCCGYRDCMKPKPKLRGLA